MDVEKLQKMSIVKLGSVCVGVSAIIDYELKIRQTALHRCSCPTDFLKILYRKIPGLV